MTNAIEALEVAVLTLKMAHEGYLACHKAAVLACPHERIIEAPYPQPWNPTRMCLTCRLEETRKYNWEALTNEFVMHVNINEVYKRRLTECATWIHDESNVHQHRPGYAHVGPGHGDGRYDGEPLGRDWA